MNKFWNGINKSAVFSIATGLLCISTGCTNFGNSDAAFENALIQAASEQNKSLPIMLDKDTRWDSNVAGPGKNWTYLYTVVSPDAQNVTEKRINDVLGEKIRNSVCTMDKMKTFVEHGVVLKYSYRNLKGQFLGNVIIRTSQCNKNKAAIPE